MATTEFELARKFFAFLSLFRASIMKAELKKDKQERIEYQPK